MNLSFLQPAFLWALPVLGAPFIIHWMTRARPRPLPFSAVELLRDSLRSRLLTSRLREILLLAARTLLLAVLLLLFARPVVHWAGPAAGFSDRLSAVLLLDASYSMGARQAGRSALERAMQEARSFLEAASPQDRVGLIVFTDRVEASVPPSEDRARILNALSERVPVHRPTDPTAALSLAHQMLAAEPPGQKAAVLLSDFAENGWRAAERSGSPFDPAVRIVLAESGPEQGNAEAGEVRVSVAGSGKGFQGILRVASWGKAGDERTWRISADGRALAQGRVSLSSREVPEPFSTPAAPARSGWGEVTLEADALAIDDSAFFLLPPRADYKVLVINGSPSLSPSQDETYYLAPVLDALAEEGLTYRQISAEDAGNADLSSWEVIILLNVRSLPPSAVSRLRDHLTAGRGIWIAGGNNVFSPEEWTLLAPGRFGPAAEGGNGLRWQPAASRHAVGHAMGGEEQFEWDNIRVDRLLAFEPASGTETLLALRDGRPVLAAGRVLGGPVAVWTATLDRDWTNLPAKPAFPVLCRSVLGFLAGRAAAREGRTLRVGEIFELPPLEAALAGLRIRRPDGTSDGLEVRPGKARYEKTDLPGPYALERASDGQVVSHFVVNLDRESGEGNLTRARKEKLQALFRRNDTLWVPFPEPLVARFRERVRGKEMAPALAAIGLLLFTLESFLTGRRARRKAV